MCLTDMSAPRHTSLRSAGSCAKQSYQAVLATKDVNVTCENGLVLQAYSGDWRCVSAPDSSPCSPGFSSAEELQGSIGARCKQVCLIDM